MNPGESQLGVRVELEVRYAETDAMGIVHHSRYLPWFEIARTHLCSRCGYHYAEIEAMGFQLMVTKAELTYRQGARYGEMVTVECHLVRQASRGLRFAYRVLRDGKTLATGATEHIWVDVKKGRPCRTPEKLKEGFARLVVSGKARAASGPA